MKIAVSGLNNTDNPAPGIPVIKSLQKRHTIIGLSYSANEPGNYMGLCEKIYLMPYPSLGFEELKNRLITIRDQEEIEAIIPNLDAELPLYIKYQEEIEAIGIKLCLPSLDNFELRNKNRLDALAKELHISHPQTYEIATENELVSLVQERHVVFPLMVKGNYYKAHKVHHLDHAIEAFYQISNEWGFPILIQEVVEGIELNLVGIGDGNGNLISAVAIKKLTTTSLGKIWTAVTIQNEQLMQIAKDFMAHTKWRGPFELECIANMHQIYLIEINPRFPAWVYFATELGINMPQTLIEIMQNTSPKPQLTYPQNKMYVRYTEELVTDMGDFTTLLSQKEL